MSTLTAAAYKGITSMDTYPEGTMKSCIFKEENLIDTDYGLLIPQYSIAGYGERQKKYRDSISFYENGNIKSVALDKQLPIKTSLGVFPAELVTFYEDGSLRRVFPLNGKIDGFWSEEDEGEMCEEFSFELPSASFSTKIIGLNFYESGTLKSITLWPKEWIDITLNETTFTVRNGISFYECGAVKSIEPAKYIRVETPIGKITAYDKDAIGIHGDTNSLVFSEEGRIIGLTTSSSGIRVTKKSTGRMQLIKPLLVDSIIDDDEKTLLPVKIRFSNDKVTFTDNCHHQFKVKDNQFSVYAPMLYDKGKCSGSSCSSCSSCG